MVAFLYFGEVIKRENKKSKVKSTETKTGKELPEERFDGRYGEPVAVKLPILLLTGFSFETAVTTFKVSLPSLFLYLFCIKLCSLYCLTAQTRS